MIWPFNEHDHFCTYTVPARTFRQSSLYRTKRKNIRRIQSREFNPRLAIVQRRRGPYLILKFSSVQYLNKIEIVKSRSNWNTLYPPLYLQVVWDNVRALGDGETVSLTGTHLGHNLPDQKGNRFVQLILKFYIILFYFNLFNFILLILNFILFSFNLFCFILFYFILFYFILFYFILFYFILFYLFFILMNTTIT